ncbi:MAG: hypothetical protein ACLT3H_15500, partial [Roseburia sp.]
CYLVEVAQFCSIFKTRPSYLQKKFHTLPDSPKLDNKFVTVGSVLKESPVSAAITGIADDITSQTTSSNTIMFCKFFATFIIPLSILSYIFCTKKPVF